MDVRNQAFYLYYGLGNDRTVELVAEAMKLPLNRIKYWATKDKWTEKTAELESYVEDKVVKKITEAQVDRMYNIWRVAIENCEAGAEKIGEIIESFIGDEKATNDVYRLQAALKTNEVIVKTAKDIASMEENEDNTMQIEVIYKDAEKDDD